MTQEEMVPILEGMAKIMRESRPLDFYKAMLLLTDDDRTAVGKLCYTVVMDILEHHDLKERLENSQPAGNC